MGRLPASSPGGQEEEVLLRVMAKRPKHPERPQQPKCQAVRPLLVAIGAGSVLALGAWRVAPGSAGRKAQTLLNHDYSLWSTRSQIRERVEPVTFGDRFKSDPGLLLAEPPACVVGELPQLWDYNEGGAAVEVKLLTYNLFWWNLYGVRQGNNGSVGRLIADAGKGSPHDIMAFQECMDPVRVLRDAELENEYTAFSGDGSNTAAICMAFRKRSWTLLGQGSEYVAEDSDIQYFGRRAAQWMRVRHDISGRSLLFMNHHGPLPVNSGGRCGGAATAYNLLQVISRHAHRGDAIILVGDFNADSTSETIRHLQRRLHKAYAGTIVNGIDNVFSNLGATAVVGAENLGTGGSDHDALSVTLSLGQRSPPRHRPPLLSRRPGPPRPPPNPQPKAEEPHPEHTHISPAVLRRPDLVSSLRSADNVIHMQKL